MIQNALSVRNKKMQTFSSFRLWNVYFYSIAKITCNVSITFNGLFQLNITNSYHLFDTIVKLK